MTSAARAVAGCGVLVAAVAGLGLAASAGDGTGEVGTGGALGPGLVTVELGIEHSAFEMSTLRVRAGTEVVFVLRNDDPIRHELIVGPEEVHDRHENGTEASHPPRPGEVSVEPLDTATTTYEFTEPGFVEFACHLPGHLAYGMAGVVEVVPA